MKKKFLIALAAVALSLNVSYASRINNEEFRDAINAVREVLIGFGNLNDAADSATIENYRIAIDSVLNAAVDNAAAYTEENGNNDNYSDFLSVSGHEYDMQKEQHLFYTRLAGISIPFITIMIIVAICLYYNYKKRTARYAMIEKAIDNNYEIPEYLANEQPGDAYNAFKNVFVSTSAQRAQPKGNYAQVPPKVRMPKEFYTDPYKWKELRSGIVIAALGLALVMAFGFNFMGALCSVLIFIGLGKIITNYLQVRDMERACEAQYYADEALYNTPKSNPAKESETVKETVTKNADKETVTVEDDIVRYAPQEIRDEIKKDNKPEPPAIPKN